MSASLVGSEMCIRDSCCSVLSYIPDRLDIDADSVARHAQAYAGKATHRSVRYCRASSGSSGS
eukprot:13149831-Alexandrium_andersonii.AAC.1